MATVQWLGLQGVTRKVYRWTVNAAAGTYTLTHNLKTISYTFVTADTAAIVAAGLVAAAGASPEPEWAELLVESDGVSVVTVTGPDDGATCTVTASVTGSATMTAGTTTAPISPHDLADVANYSTGALPANSDTLVLVAGSADIKYNNEALNAITGLTIVREAGGPAFGLPDYRAANYREYRPTRLKFPATTVTIYTTQADAAGAMRLHLSSATCVLKVIGDQGGFGTIGQEVLEVISSGNSSTLACTNSSIAVSPLISTTAGFTTIVGDNSTVNLGSGVTTVTDEFTDCTVQVACNWTTLTAAGNGTLTEVGTATGALVANQGTVNWNGTGALASPEIGAGVTLDLSGGSAAVAVTGQIVMYEGAVLNDPGSRITVPFSVYRYRCPVDGLTVGRHRKVTVDAIP